MRWRRRIRGVEGCTCMACLPAAGEVPSHAHQFLLDGVRERSWFGYEADRRRIAWVYSIGFEHTYGQPEVVIAGLDRIQTSRMLDAIAGLYARGEPLGEGDVIARVGEDDVVFRALHPEWLSGTDLVAGADWFNRGTTRARQLVGAAPGGVPWPEQPRLWLPPAEQSLRGWRLFTTPDDADWPYPVPWDTPIFVHKTITSRNDWIYSVRHDDDDAWQCIDGFDHPDTKDWELVALSVIIELDESIAETLDLAPGESAWRDSPAAPWQRERLSPDET